LPAITKWFSKSPCGRHVVLNHDHLVRFGSTLVPLEIRHNDRFARVEQSLSFFLECVNAHEGWPFLPLLRVSCAATKRCLTVSSSVPRT
jgi:hypothetical protein